LTKPQQVNASRPTGGPRHEPVFLLAPARSYSTVTLALLAGHPDVYGFPEMGLFPARTVGDLLAPEPTPRRPASLVEFKRGGILRAVADLREESQEEPAIRRAEAWLAERSSWPPRQLMDYLLGLAYPRTGLEKSPETVSTAEALDACLASYPHARYVHLTRHPASTMRSVQEHWGRWPGRSKKALVVSAASAWYQGHARIVRTLAQLPARQRARIRAEDLLREPLTRLPPLLDWLGLRGDRDIVSEMTHTENWQFASTGPSGRLFGGDPSFMRSPELRLVPEPGEIDFDESWGLLDEMRERMTALARYLEY
jgi:Sulfotransferase family